MASCRCLGAWSHQSQLPRWPEHHLPRFSSASSITPTSCPPYLSFTSVIPLGDLRSSPSTTTNACFPIHNDQSTSSDGGGGEKGNNGNNNGDDGGSGEQCWWNPEGWWSPSCLSLLFLGSRIPDEESPSMELLSILSCLCLSLISASSVLAGDMFSSAVWEVKGGKRTRLVPDPSGADAFVVDGKLSFKSWRQGCAGLILPEGYPDSVSDDYLEYCLWRGVQGVASQISGVLSTRALLYAVGLGKGAIPMAAAINWVLKDGIGYLSKILLSKFGRHFDVNPKGWRLFADLLENAAYGMEILTPAYPHLFVFLGAAAGAGRSAASLIQAATKSCFYAGFAVQRNFAEVIAKGEAQGMVSKFFGITLGIALSSYIGSSTPLTLLSLGVLTGVHIYCNFKSYQSIQLRTLNPYRASLVFSEYLLSGQIPFIREVNDEEPLFPALPVFNIRTHTHQPQILSSEAKDAAAEICHRLQLGCKLSEVVNNKEDAIALFNLFRDEAYLLAVDKGRFCVILKEDSSPLDMLKSLFHVNYLSWLEQNMGLESRGVVDDCNPGGRLQISLDYVQREFSHVNHDGLLYGWIMDGLIARPWANRIRPGYSASTHTT